MPNLLVDLIGVALAGWIIWLVLRPKYAFRIVVDQRGVRHHRGLPKGQQREVLRFLQDEVSLDGRTTICANRQTTGQLRFNFKGRINPGAQQQIRNFLNSVL